MPPKARTSTASTSSSSSSGDGKKKLRKSVKRISMAKKMDNTMAQLQALKDAEAILAKMNAPKEPKPPEPIEEPPAPPEEVLEEDGDLDEPPPPAAAPEPDLADLVESDEDVPEEPPAPTKGMVEVVVGDFNHDFEIEDGKLAWATIDQRFGITAGTFDDIDYVAKFGAEFDRPMVDPDGEEVDLGISRETYFGLQIGYTYVLKLPVPERPPTPPPEEETVRVKFNHYNEEFKIRDGQLTWADIDANLCISFVYKGNFQRHIYDEEGEKLRLSGDREVYHGLENGKTYTLKVVEDAEQAKLPRKSYKASGNDPMAAMRKNMNDMGLGEDNASCSCIEGNPCMSAYNCKDWNNRFAVAKAHGWKGHS